LKCRASLGFCSTAATTSRTSRRFAPSKIPATRSWRTASASSSRRFLEADVGHLDREDPAGAEAPTLPVTFP